MKTFWLSYAGEEGSRGVVVTEAFSFLEACALVGAIGLSPGGEVLGFEVPMDDPEVAEEIVFYEHNRLYTPEELRQRGAMTRREHEAKRKEMTT